MMKSILVPLAPGFEEIEAVTVIDILRRAGAGVCVAGTSKGEIEGRNKIRVMPDVLLEDVVDQPFDMVVLPGGSVGAEHLRRDPRIKQILKGMAAEGKFITAICAAPTVLCAVGLLRGKNVTSHPSVRDELSETKYSEARVVVDGNIVTSRSPGTALEFAMKLVEILEGQSKMEEVNRSVLGRI
jgi:protein deglycase